MEQSVTNNHKSFQFGLKILRFIGLDPTRRTKISVVISGISLTWAVLFAIWAIAGLFEQELTLQNFAKQVQAFATITFVLSRQYVLMMYWDDLKTILNGSVIDWPIKNKVNEVSLDKALKMFKIFMFLGFMNWLILTLKPWILHELPLALYSGSINFWIVYIIQVIFTNYALVLMFGFDIIYASICIHLNNQLKHVGRFFENVSFSNKTEMKEGVRRYVAIMRAIKTTSKVYAVIFTTLIWICIIMSCIESYMDMETNNTIVGILRHGVVYSFAIAFCSFYVILADNITQEGLNIAGAIYNTKWYEASQPDKIYVQMVMMRAQVPMNFTLNGFATISRLTIVFALQTTYSYYTVFRTMKSGQH